MSEQLDILEIVGERLETIPIAYMLVAKMELDRDYIGRWAEELGVSALWKDITA